MTAAGLITAITGFFTPLQAWPQLLGGSSEVCGEVPPPKKKVLG